MLNNDFTNKLAEKIKHNSTIEESYYSKYDVKRGLRNANGTGVLVGLTEVGSVHGYRVDDNIKIPDVGRLYYRGYNIYDLVEGFQSEKRFGFEEIAYLLLVGELPSTDELNDFKMILSQNRRLPDGFTENMILKIPSNNIMNKLQRSVLVLYSHDDNPDDVSVENLMLQSIKLIGLFPTIISYGYQAKSHYFDNKSLFIHQPDENLSTAENILLLSRADKSYTQTEAETLDLLLVIHAEHGGGNNSAFATHVVSSSGTDTYSAISAAIGSLKGPKHGGASLKVSEMISDIKLNCPDFLDKSELKNYLRKILNKETFDRKGLIYGMGHAIYTLSDPRAVLLKAKALELAIEKNNTELFELYNSIEILTQELFKEIKGEENIISANVDLYSGFVYEMLGIPSDLYTALFATARIVGWCGHRIEQILSDPKIIRPAYKSVTEDLYYINMSDR